MKNKPASPPISAPVSVNATVEAPDINGSVSLPSVPISKPVPSSTGLQRFLDKAVDEGLVMLKSPRVRTQLNFSSNYSFYNENSGYVN